LYTETLPSRVDDFQPRRPVAEIHEAQFDVGGVAAVAVDVPEISETARRSPERDFSPVELGAVRSPLEDPTAKSSRRPRRSGRRTLGVAGGQAPPSCPRGLGCRGLLDSRPTISKISAHCVLRHQPESPDGITPNLREIRLHGFDAFRMQSVDTAGSLRFFDDETRQLQQPKVPRHRRPADREGVCNLLDREPPGSEELDDGSAVRVSEGFEGISDRGARRHAGVTLVVRRSSMQRR